MVCQHDQNRAIQYLLTQLDSVAMWGDILQMAVLELIRKVRCLLTSNEIICSAPSACIPYNLSCKDLVGTPIRTLR